MPRCTEIQNLHRYKLMPGNPESRFAFYDDGSRLIVEWRDVYLAIKEEVREMSFQVSYGDNFSGMNCTSLTCYFQAILSQNGDITFVYKTVTGSIGTVRNGFSGNRNKSLHHLKSMSAK